MLPLHLAHLSPETKRRLNLFSHFCTAHDIMSSVMPGYVLSAKNCSFHEGSEPPSNIMVALAPLSSQPKRHIDQFNCFCTAHGRMLLGMP